MREIRMLAASVCAALGSLAPGADADVMRWDFPIRGDQVRNGDEPDGSTDSTATGYGHFVYDTETKLLTYTISWRGLEGELTKLHIHGPALPGENQPNHLIELLNSPGDVASAGLDPHTDSITGSLELDDTATECTEVAGTPGAPASSTLPCLLEGRAYVNVHTTVNPMGETRGNVVLQPEVIAFHFEADEGQVRNGPLPDGSTGSGGSGLVSARYDVAAETLHYTMSWSDLEGELTKLHVHGPADADASEPNHLFEIFNTPSDVASEGLDPQSDEFTSSIPLVATGTECVLESGTGQMAAAATLPCLFEGRAYVNIHTTLHPMGELRGNSRAVPALAVWRFPIDGSQVRNGNQPDGTTDSTATGWGTFRFDQHTGLLGWRIRYDGLEGELTKLHVHGPADANSNNPNHLVEIFNSPGDVAAAGLDPNSDAAEGEIALDLMETRCIETAGTPTTAAASSLPCFLSGLAYVNVHTTLHPMGETRGNLELLPHPYLWSFPIDESQVLNGPEPDGSTDSTATGGGRFVYDANTQELRAAISWIRLQSELTKLHIHGPADSSESTPVHLVEYFNTLGDVLGAELDPITDTLYASSRLERGATACTGDPAAAGSGVDEAAPGALPCFLEERAYVNVHTTTFPMGEIRGNLVLVPEPSGGAVVALGAVAALGYRRRRARRAAAIQVSPSMQASAAFEGSGKRSIDVQ